MDINSTLTSVFKNVSNLTTSSYISSASEVSRDWIVLVLYLMTTVLAITGNIFVCLVVYNKKNLRSTTYSLVVSMAISDIIGGLVIPLQWLFCSTYLLNMGWAAERMCGLSKTLQFLSYYVSTFSMTAIAIDRYLLICKPLAKRMDSIKPIIITWVLGVLLCSHTFFALRVSEFFAPEAIMSCRVLFPLEVSLTLRKVRAMLVIITQYLIPLLMTAYFYSMVVFVVWKRQNVGNTSEEKKKSFDKNKKKTIKMLIVVTALFAIAWFPTQLMHYLKFFTKVIPIEKGKCNASTFYIMCYWLGISSCAFNPFVYCYFNKDFRGEAVRYWNLIIPFRFRIECKINSEENSNVTTTSSTGNANTSV